MISSKDLKLLWGRAAGRCSICRIELSQEKQFATEIFPIGEHAHIVAEQEKGPRGESILTSQGICQDVLHDRGEFSDDRLAFPGFNIHCHPSTSPAQSSGVPQSLPALADTCGILPADAARCCRSPRQLVGWRFSTNIPQRSYPCLYK